MKLQAVAAPDLPHLWKWERLVRLSDDAGHIVPVGRGGEITDAERATPDRSRSERLRAHSEEKGNR